VSRTRKSKSLLVMPMNTEAARSFNIPDYSKVMWPTVAGRYGAGSCLIMRVNAYLQVHIHIQIMRDAVALPMVP
jgi:phage tail sheath gpL-like